MTTSPRRALAALLLSVWTLQGCYVMTPAAGPHPGQNIDGVVLHDGETVEFPSRWRGALEDSAVVARTGDYDKVVGRFPITEIDHVLTREASPGRTIAAILIVGVVAGALLVASHDPFEGYRPFAPAP